MASVACATDFQIDSFDDISGWSVFPADKIVQGIPGGDPNFVKEGVGSLIANYTSPIDLSGYFISKTCPSMDLSPAAIGATEAAISLWMWIGKNTMTVRMTRIKLASEYYNSEFTYELLPWNKTYPIGWHQVIIPQSHFVESTTSTVTPDWSNITYILITTSPYPDGTPTDIAFDDLRLIVHVTPQPTFTRDPINGPYGFAGMAFTDSLVDEVEVLNPGSLLTFSKVSGPAWLAVAADGILSGTPTAGDIGQNSFRVRVHQGSGPPGPSASEADLIIPVANNYSGLGKTFRIMAVGDSITTGYTDNPAWTVPFAFGYRSELYTLLTHAGFDFQFVGGSPEPWNGLSGMPTNTPSPDLRPLGQDNHRGYGGSGIAGISGGIVNWLNSDNPNVILLMIGINDILPGPTDPINQKNDLNNLVNTIVTTKPEADLVIAQITPVSYNSDSHVQYNTYIRNTLVPNYVSQGYKVSTVDQYSNFLTGTGDVDPARFSNGINHPDAIGYRRMAETWFGGIVALVGPQ